MTPLEQLEKWVKGESIHNIKRNECCPDFSCCGEPLADEETRKCFRDAYINNDTDTLNLMLSNFLSNLLKKGNKSKE